MANFYRKSDIPDDLKHYFCPAELGLEESPQAYVAALVAVFDGVKRVLRSDGVAWLNLGSSYASGDSGSSRTRQLDHVPACGNGGTEPQGLSVPDSAYHGLCDECLADYLTHRARTVDTAQPLERSVLHAAQTIHDSERLDSAEASQDASLLDAQESTTLESWRRLRGECSRCDSRAFSLSSLRSSSVDARQFAHMAENTSDKAPPAGSWDSRTSDMGLSSTASDNPSIVQPQYTIFKPKDMVPIPWMVAMALQAEGWYLRSEIIWSKPNPMPESVTDRPTKSHEYVFLLTKSSRYFYDKDAIGEPAVTVGDTRHLRTDNTQITARIGGDDSRIRTGRPQASNRNVRTVWEVATAPYAEAHFATFPPKLIEPMIKAGTSERGCCPACGAPWVRVVDVEYENPGNRSTNGPRSEDRKHMQYGTAGYAVRLERRSTTTGWQSSCTCDAGDPIPCTVLDPFIGSGTTALVAQRLGRRAIGIDLNSDYLDLAIKRTAQKALWFNTTNGATP